MAITIEMILKNLGLIQSAKESSEAVGEIAGTFDDLGDTSLDATDRAKLALQELYRVQVDQARATNVVYQDMTRAQQEEFRARYDTEADFQFAVQDLNRKREDAERQLLDGMSTEYKRVFGEIENTAEDAHKSVGDTAKDGFGKVGDAASDAGDTVTDTLGDALGSLDGTAQGAADGALGALRGFSALIPGVGAAIGAALATVAAPMVRGFFDSAEESESRIEQMYDHFKQSGLNYLEYKQIEAQVEKNLDDNTMRSRAQAVADYFKIPMVAAMAMITENGAEADQMLAEVEERFNSLSAHAPAHIANPIVDAYEAMRDTNAEFTGGLTKAQELRRALDYVREPIDMATDAAIETNAELDRMANPRAASVTIQVDTDAAERAIERLRAKAARDITTEFYVTQNGRVIR